jgi:hypothetical protein
MITKEYRESSGECADCPYEAPTDLEDPSSVSSQLGASRVSRGTELGFTIWLCHV